MALRECAFPFWTSQAEGMPSRAAAASRLSRIAAATDSKDSVEHEDDGESRVVESLSYVTSENRWYLLVPNGSLPAARAKHGALSIGRRMFVLGGASADGILDDVQVFHAERSVWLQLGCGSAPSLHSPTRSIPPDARGPRCVGHCLAFWETKLVVIGGSIGPKSQKLKAFALDLESQSWSVLAPKGEIPVARTGQTVVQVGSVLVLFGGEDSKGQLLNDVYVLDLNALVWLPLKTNGSKPSPRRGHSAACFRERYMFVFGGKANGNYLNDLHCLDLQTMEWSKEKAKGVVPTARAGQAGVMAGNKWYIVGGEHRGSEVLDTLAFDVPSRSWSVITTVQPGTPLANDGLSAVKIRNKGKSFVVIFGGHGAILSNQVFVMMVSNGRSGPPNRRSEEANDELSTSSLPFSFTTGSLQTIQNVLNSERSPRSRSRSRREVMHRAVERSYESTKSAEAGEARLGDSYASETEPSLQSFSRDKDLESAGVDKESGRSMEEACAMMEARRTTEELQLGLTEALSKNAETEKALTNVLRGKEMAEKRLEEALSTIGGLERDMESMAESRAEGERRLRMAMAQVEELESRLKHFLDESEAKLRRDDKPQDVDETSRLSQLQQRVQESEEQIIFSVRKQALAERKLLSALKENRELKKQLLLAKHHDDFSAEEPPA